MNVQKMRKFVSNEFPINLDLIHSHISTYKYV